MSLERQDIRAKLDHDMHAALKVLCDVDGCDVGEFVERELVRVIVKRCHAASLVAAALTDAGISGRVIGAAGKGRD